MFISIVNTSPILYLNILLLCKQSNVVMLYQLSCKLLVSYCAILRLDSLSTRHKLTDVMFIYNILNNLIECFELLLEIGSCVPGRNTKNLDLFVVPNYSTTSGT